MEGQINPKIVGATIIGFAFIFGAYIINNFGKAPQLPQVATVQQVSVPPRVSIEVYDDNRNGIEDWRDSFITTPPIYLNKDQNEPYRPPDTLTGQLGIDLFESYVRAKSSGPFGASKEELLSKTVQGLAEATEQKIYHERDLTIMTSWEDEDIVNYANTVAATIERYNIKGMEQELFILNDVAKKQKTERVADLERIAAAYRHYREDTLQIPVPEIFAKEHLDLINTYEAIYTDISAMALYPDDPARTLLRLKRYEDDAAGLAMALQNMFEALAPHASLFTLDDRAILFAKYSPDYQG